MKKLYLTSVVLVLSLSSLFAIEVLSVSQMINMSIRQRGRTQKLLKSWLLKNENITVDFVTKELVSNTLQFDDNLEQLQDKVPNQEIKLALKKVELQWGIFKKLIENDSNKNTLITVKASINTLNASQEVVEAVIKFAKNQNLSGNINTNNIYAYDDILAITDVCCRQRLQSQRLVIYYSLSISGKLFNATPNKTAIEAAEMINSNFKKLMSNELTNSEISDEIVTIYADWKKTYDLIKANNYEAIEKRTITLESLNDKMNKLFNSIDKVISMYANLIKN